MLRKNSIFFFNIKLILLFCGIYFFNHNNLLAQQQMDMDLPVLSEEDFKNLSPEEQQSYMQAVTENIFQNLSPEQQEEVQQEIAKIEAMSDEEREAYLRQVEQELEKAFQQEQKPSAAPTDFKKPPVIQEPIEKPVEEKPKKKKSIDKKKEAKIKQAVILINEIIATIDSFELKIATIDNFDEKFSKWAQRRKIDVEIKNISWQKINQQLQMFKQQLYKLKDRDTKTKKYKYISYLLKNEDLYSQLYTFSTTFDEYVSQINVQVESLDPVVKKQSSKALRIATNLIINTLLNKDKNIIESINDVFKSYDPKAKKIESQESALTSKALSESKKSIRQTPVKLVGQKEQFAVGSDMPDEYFQGLDSSPSGYVPQQKTAPGLSQSDKKDSGSKKNKSESLKKDDKDDKEEKEKLSSQELVKKLESILEDISGIFKETQRFDDIFATVVDNVKDFNLVQTHIPKLNALCQQAKEVIVELIEQIKEENIEATVEKKYKKNIELKSNPLLAKLNVLQSDIAKLYANKELDLPLDILWMYKGIDNSLDLSLALINKSFNDFASTFESEFEKIRKEAFSKLNDKDKERIKVLQEKLVSNQITIPEKNQLQTLKNRGIAEMSKSESSQEDKNKANQYKELNKFSNLSDEQLQKEFQELDQKVKNQIISITSELTDTEDNKAKTIWQNLSKKIVDKTASKKEQKQFQKLYDEYYNQAVTTGLTQEEKENLKKIEFIFQISTIITNLEEQMQSKLSLKESLQKLGNLKLLTVNELSFITEFMQQQIAQLQQNVNKSNKILQPIKERVPSPVGLDILQKNIQGFISAIKLFINK